MNAMNIPGFTAEASLYKTNGRCFLQSLADTAIFGKAGMVYPARFQCWRSGCACAGDWDCNGMFSNPSACTGSWAQCWVRGSGPEPRSVFCMCSRSMGSAAMSDMIR